MSTRTFEGQPLVEVLGVRFLHAGGEAPAGTISVFDGKRGQIIYSGSPADKPCSRQTQRSGLRLTGPYRAISGDGCVAFVLDLHGTALSSSPSSYVDEILLDVYDEHTRYDEAITHSVSSACGDGHVEVRYALLSDAAEAVIEVKLLRPGASGTVTGTVVARTGLGEVVLFDGDDGASVGSGTEEGIVVPLARSVVAVPLASPLTVEVDLVEGDSEVVVKESVVCVPKLGTEEVCRRPIPGVAAVLEVKITWLD